MSERKITTAVILRYALFQLPEFVLFVAALLLAGHWITISQGFFWGFLAFLILKDAVVFPFVWHAYDTRDVKRINHLIGKRGEVVEPLQPQGVVRVNGELWKAEAVVKGTVLDRGTSVRIEKVKGFCLIVAEGDPRG